MPEITVNAKAYRGNLMNILPALLLSGAALSFAEKPAPKVTDRNISVTAFVDAGQVVQGSLVNDDGTHPKPVENLFLNRDGIALTYSGTVEDRLRINIGVGGLFWKPVPEAQDAATKRINFGPGISEASGAYDFTPALSLKFGFFGYKYNPEAVNLGEYLLRSEAYPGVIHTGSPGGWVWLNSNEYKSMGVQLSWIMLNGALRHDVLLFSEFNDAPIFDFSPSYVATLKVGPALEFGAGFSLHRWLPIQGSKTTPRGEQNTYVEVKDFPAYEGFAGGTVKGIESDISAYADSTGTPVVTLAADSNGRRIFIRSDNGDTLYARTRERLTFKAVKVMARASLNLATLLRMDEERTGAFKVFTEVAVLGVQDQPYYYEKIRNRIPVMAGVNLPAFGVLDLVSLQVEYFNNPYPDNNYQQFNNTLPQPTLTPDYETLKRQGKYEDDDLKWSVLLKKTVVAGLDIYLQAANDHFRVQDGSAQPSFMPLTQTPSDWYYMLRFQWSL